jgi:serine/threonine protein phosphatase PrpC
MLAVRCAVRSDIGLEREDNEDAAYAGARLLAVADGLGGHGGGHDNITCIVADVVPAGVPATA